MREIVFFVASLAGAVILTALAVVIQPNSPIWRWMLCGGIAVFAACAIVLLVDMARPGGRVILLLGLGTGIATALCFGIAIFFQPTPQSSATPNEEIPIPKLSDLYVTDFPEYMRFTSGSIVTIPIGGGRGIVTEVGLTQHFDMRAKLKFYSMYVPPSDATYEICKLLATTFQASWAIR